MNDTALAAPSGFATEETEPGRGRPYSRCGVSTVHGHHGELLQGVFRDGDQRHRPALLSLPSTMYSTTARFQADVHDGDALSVFPPDKVKALAAARATLMAVDLPRRGGRLRLHGDVPVGRGFGSSTSDVVAAILAVADAVGVTLPGETLAEVAVRSEAASDPLMYPDRHLLFAHRAGNVIEDLGPDIPALRVLGFGTSATAQGVDTLSLPPVQYDRDELARFGMLRSALRDAMRDQDAALLGRVATASTEINQRHRPSELLSRALPLVGSGSALGIQTAHSGDIAGLLFDATDPDVERELDDAARHLAMLGIPQTWRFTVGVSA